MENDLWIAYKTVYEIFLEIRFQISGILQMYTYGFDSNAGMLLHISCGLLPFDIEPQP